MFWRKNTKLPITKEDQKWVEESLSFLNQILDKNQLLSMTTVEPTHDFFDREFDGTEEDALYVLERCKTLMFIEAVPIQLSFFSESSNYMDDGTLLTTDADIHGRSKGAAGTYQQLDNLTIIRLERSQLQSPEAMIATISHELSHQKLLGENRIDQNDEYLTDLTAIVFGFGIFIGNARFQFNTGLHNGFGWQMKSQGYLPEPMIGYAMASLSLKKGETDRKYVDHLNDSLKKYYKKSLAYLESEREKRDPVDFWAISEVEKHKSTSEPIEERKFIEESVLTPKEQKELQQQLIMACYSRDIPLVISILEQGVSPNFNGIGGSPLTIAASSNNQTLVDCLLQYGAELNFYEESLFDKTPLMAACSSGHLSMISYLINKGAAINHVSGNGKSVVAIAVETQNQEVVALLLEKGATIEMKSVLGFGQAKTPICFAVEKNDTAMVTFLVKNGAKTKPIRKLDRQTIHPKMIKFLKSKKYL
ncbi:hypothetical protein GCM10022393_15860 [Aquimarina addita]|uniref:Ankyrin repeat domain-containing protein n=1 Tax=Aquimarina addita TaxID=870485 RepID=A0ABP7XH92_9FLAO